MPYATNPRDGIRVYFEDDGGDGPAVILHGGLFDSVAMVRESRIAYALPREESRCVYVDHRGVGRSDKPHDVTAYTTGLRVADAVAVADELGVEQAHFVGTEWGGRLGFGIGAYAPERVRSLVIGSQHPYAIDPCGRVTRVITDGLLRARSQGMDAIIRALEEFWSVKLPPRERLRYLDNDPAALHAAWSAALAEGPVCADLDTWSLPCLIFAGAREIDHLEQARQAAAEIPGAEFIALDDPDHDRSGRGDPLRRAVLRLLRQSRPEPAHPSR